MNLSINQDPNKSQTYLLQKPNTKQGHIMKKHFNPQIDNNLKEMHYKLSNQNLEISIDQSIQNLKLEQGQDQFQDKSIDEENSETSIYNLDNPKTNKSKKNTYLQKQTTINSTRTHKKLNYTSTKLKSKSKLENFLTKKNSIFNLKKQKTQKINSPDDLNRYLYEYPDSFLEKPGQKFLKFRLIEFLQKQINNYNQLTQTPNKTFYTKQNYNNSLINPDQQKTLNFAKNSAFHKQQSKQFSQVLNSPFRLQTQNKLYSIRHRSSKKGLNIVWQAKGILILSSIIKFISILKGMSIEHRFTLLDKVKLDIIGDNSYDYNFYKYNFYIKKEIPSFLQLKIYKFTNYFKKFLPQIQNTHNFVILPESNFNIIWECFYITCLIINTFFISLKISFTSSNLFNLDKYMDFLFYQLPQFIFIVDTLLKFNIGYYDKGSLIIDRIKISQKHIKKNFFFSFLLSFLFFINYSLDSPIIQLFLLTRSVQILKNIEHISDTLSLKKKHRAIFDLIKLTIIILLIAHLCGCIFVYVALVQKQQNIKETWIEVAVVESNILIDLNSWFDIYIASFYFSVITMITVGYGELYPINNLERLITILITILSCGVFAYSVNEIGTIFKLMKQQKEEFKEEQAILVNHMKRKGLSKDLQNRVTKYYEYIYNENLQEKQIGDRLIQNLPYSLAQSIKFEFNYQIFSEQKLLLNNFSEAFVKKLANTAKENRFGPEHEIIKEGHEVSDLFFITSGSVDLFQQVGKKQIYVKTIHKQDGIGNYFFISQQYSTLTAKTKNVVGLISVSKQDFLNCLKEFPPDFEHYSMMRDNIIFYKSNRQIHEKCKICDISDHIDIKQCPFISFVPNKYQIINKSLNIGLYQERISFNKRREGRYENYKAQFQLLKESVYFFMITNYPEVELHHIFKQNVEYLNRDLSKKFSRNYSKNYSYSINGTNTVSGRPQFNLHNIPHSHNGLTSQLSNNLQATNLIQQNDQIKSSSKQYMAQSQTQSPRSQYEENYYNRPHHHSFQSNNNNVKFQKGSQRQSQEDYDPASNNNLYEPLQQQMYQSFNLEQVELQNNKYNSLGRERSFEQDVQSQFHRKTRKNLTTEIATKFNNSFIQEYDQSSQYTDNNKSTFYKNLKQDTNYQSYVDTSSYYQYGLQQQQTQQTMHDTSYMKQNTLQNMHTNFFNNVNQQIVNISEDDKLLLKFLKFKNKESIIGFDTMKIFNYYYTRGNLDRILEFLDEKRYKQLKTKTDKLLRMQNNSRKVSTYSPHLKFKSQKRINTNFEIQLNPQQMDKNNSNNNSNNNIRNSPYQDINTPKKTNPTTPSINQVKESPLQK